eukprot:CAMPEP_0184644892 /NCGR_PEP_ID=MMETSP0308-20130426/1498_1 /TAXON_ID=38269 /ORGANISM="Gloeochaete witrockiana, Strain SAG 46.84" /LENGTH=396 /DNA_ID=CAMNT_0027073625 /DNA_START=844 /DNA_END=2034 /DNA_ORIENTATION=+
MGPSSAPQQRGAPISHFAEKRMPDRSSSDVGVSASSVPITSEAVNAAGLPPLRPPSLPLNIPILASDPTMMSSATSRPSSIHPSSSRHIVTGHGNPSPGFIMTGRGTPSPGPPLSASPHSLRNSPASHRVLQAGYSPGSPTANLYSTRSSSATAAGGGGVGVANYSSSALSPSLLPSSQSPSTTFPISVPSRYHDQQQQQIVPYYGSVQTPQENTPPFSTTPASFPHPLLLSTTPPFSHMPPMAVTSSLAYATHAGSSSALKSLLQKFPETWPSPQQQPSSTSSTLAIQRSPTAGGTSAAQRLNVTPFKDSTRSPTALPPSQSEPAVRFPRMTEDPEAAFLADSGHDVLNSAAQVIQMCKQTPELTIFSRRTIQSNLAEELAAFTKLRDELISSMR